MRPGDIGCARSRLASGPLAVVERCHCGTVHLTIGTLTLRLAPAACESLCRTLVDALRALREIRTAGGEYS